MEAYATAATATTLLAVLTLIKPLLIAGLILAAGKVGIKMICRIMKGWLENSRLDPLMHTFAINCARVLLWILVGLTAINYLGIPPTSILTALGACGVAIALALKDSLSNFAGGVLISVNKPFTKGDYISNLNVEGTVQEIDLLCTTLTTVDNKVITIPNGTLANDTIINYSRAENRRLDLVFAIDFKDDIDKAKDIILAVAESSGMLMRQPEPVIGVKNHGDRGILLDAKMWCKNAEYWSLYYYMNEQVKIAFDEQGVSIPYSKVEVHMDKAK